MLVSFSSNALLWSLSSEATWVVRVSSGALVWMLPRDVTEKLSYRLQALSSLFFDVMPSILRIRLDGWFSRCRGQSSGKSASRQRAKKYQQSYERCSRDVQESHESQEPRESSQEHARERFATRALFSTVRLAPAHGRLVESDCPYGAEPRPCPGLLGWNLSSVISFHFWER